MGHKGKCFSAALGYSHSAGFKHSINTAKVYCFCYLRSDLYRSNMLLCLFYCF